MHLSIRSIKLLYSIFTSILTWVDDLVSVF